MSRMSEKSANKENQLKTEDDELKVHIPQYCKLKCDHLESLIFNSKIFCESNNMPQFKKYLQSNYQKFVDLSNENASLQKQVDCDQIHYSLQTEDIDPEQEQELLLMNLKALEQEEQSYLSAIKIKQQQLNNKVFYREYQYMLQEKVGLLEQNNKQQLKKKDEKIRQFQFLEEDEFEKILYVKKEDLAVSLPWYTSIIINFWTEDINLNYLNGIKLLFMNKTIKNLQEITFKFFTKIPQDSILFLFKYKVIHGQDIQYIHIELNYKDEYDISIAKEVSQQERTPEEICKQTLNDICFEYLIILGKIQLVKDQNYIIGNILKHQFESLLLHFHGFQKLIINKNLDEIEAVLQAEIYFYEKWLAIEEEVILKNFDETHNMILKYLENKPECCLDIAFILNEAQAQQQDLVVILNQFMITIFSKTQLSMTEIKLFIMPFQIYFTYDVEELSLFLDMNLIQQDNIDISSDGVLILLNALNQCKQVSFLQIKVSLPEESDNKNFHLFKFAMIMNEMSLILKNGAIFIYNDSQIIPYKGQLKLLGKYDLYLDEHMCTYDIRYLRCIDLQKELIAIIQYLTIYNLKIRVLDIACDGGEFNLSSNKFKLDISHRICSLPYLLNFRLNFKGRSLITWEESNIIYAALRVRKRLIKQIVILETKKIRKEIIEKVLSLYNI